MSRSQDPKHSRKDFVPVSSDGCVYLNKNGSVKYEDMFVVTEGLLRNHKGTWIVSFTRLQIALDHGFRKVLIWTDNLEAVNLIHEGFREGSNSALVMRIILLLKLLSHWNLQHILREENRIAEKRQGTRVAVS
ncbi:uncharacterized protein LOC128286801 [Gossypium arboreum]|nr:uncharacterized protein LOC128286801 [Gossypium arboreum]